MAHHLQRRFAGSLPRYPHRRLAGSRPCRRGDCTLALHRLRQPFLEPRLEPADRLLACYDLYLRRRTLRRLAPAGVGCGPGLARSSARHQYCRQNPTLARNFATKVIDMTQTSAKPAYNRTESAESSAMGAMETVLKPPVPSGSQTVLEAPLRMQVRNLDFYYGKLHALHSVNLQITANRVTALIGPSGCGKSTLIRTFNRMHETVRGTRLEGEILLDGEDVFAQDVTRLRRRIGMVFQRPNPFPKSIFENVAYGLRINGLPAARRGHLSDAVEHSLRRAALWDEVNDQLHKSAYALSGGQQQRLCIARALAVDPEVLLLDEPCSALDPVNTAKIEELLFHLKQNCTLVIVTHNMQQAARVRDATAFLLNGELIEFRPTPQLFTTPSDPRTEAYITSRFG